MEQAERVVIQALVTEVEQLRRQGFIADEVEHNLVDLNTRLETEKEGLQQEVNRLKEQRRIAIDALEYTAKHGCRDHAGLAQDALNDMNEVGAIYG